MTALRRVGTVAVAGLLTAVTSFAALAGFYVTLVTCRPDSGEKAASACHVIDRHPLLSLIVGVCVPVVGMSALFACVLYGVTRLRYSLAVALGVAGAWAVYYAVVVVPS